MTAYSLMNECRSNVTLVNMLATILQNYSLKEKSYCKVTCYDEKQLSFTTVKTFGISKKFQIFVKMSTKHENIH